MARLLNIGGINIRNSPGTVIIRFIAAQIGARRKLLVFFANTNFVNTCRPALRNARGSKVRQLVLPDGLGIDAAAIALHGRAFLENQNGSDFIPRLLAYDSKWTIYLLGAAKSSVELAAQNLTRTWGNTVVGRSDGYDFWAHQEAVVAEINRLRPDILMVAFGNPLQEQWALANAERLDATVIMGVGALFDFMSGQRPRAPNSFRRLRLEWLYRLILEPRRLGFRYSIGMLQFSWLVLLQRLKVNVGNETS